MSGASKTGDSLELRDDGAQSLVTLVPSRGAIVTRLRVGERELLYLDESTLLDPGKNVRGGIPLLFPSPGKLAGDHYEHAGHSGSMKQHGFARDVAWQVKSHEGRSATLAIESSDATRAMYPWEFRAAITYTLRGRCLRLDFDVDNTGAEPMPFGFGIHPYFAVADKGAARIATKATRAFDNVTKKESPFHGFDLTAGEVDLHLLDHGSTSSELAWDDGAKLAIRGSAEFVRWVVWTLPEKPFVCVEPWTAPGNALNTGESLIELAPGGRRALWLELELA